MKTMNREMKRRRVFLEVGAAAMVVVALAGCASENGKPLPPPSQNEPVPPKIPEPNTNPTMNGLPYSGPAPIQYIGPETGAPR